MGMKWILRLASSASSLLHENTLHSSTLPLFRHYNNHLPYSPMFLIYNYFCTSTFNAISTTQPFRIHGNPRVGKLRDALLKASYPHDFDKFLDEESKALKNPGTHLLLDLLNTLESTPKIAIQTFNWKRKQLDVVPDPREYAKAICIAGKSKNIDLAVELFMEVSDRGFNRSTSMYNALMTAYISNMMTKKALALFENLSKDPICVPNIVSYNLLISIYGHSLKVDQMKRVLKEIEEAGLTATLKTYNNLIFGYLVAWMWEEMENAFKKMKENGIKPDRKTYCLLVRGYAYSGNIEKMEEAFSHVEDQKNQRDMSIVEAMICAYSKSKDLEKMENLIMSVPKKRYRFWFDTFLIKGYAEKRNIQKMESCISRALEHKALIVTYTVARDVSEAYFFHKDVEGLEKFAKQAKKSGWKLSYVVFHYRMQLYASQKQFDEMERVFAEMTTSTCIRPNRDTYLILYRTYVEYGKQTELERTIENMRAAGIPYFGRDK